MDTAVDAAVIRSGKNSQSLAYIRLVQKCRLTQVWPFPGQVEHLRYCHIRFKYCSNLSHRKGKLRKPMILSGRIKYKQLALAP
ncbi:Uncharacterised protein [Legionella israelensis]|nr:Uncharacterised protein [Legionella israelensis]